MDTHQEDRNTVWQFAPVVTAFGLKIPAPQSSRQPDRKGGKMTAKYRAWIRIRGGFDKYGSDLFATRREVLTDAVKIIREVKADPDCEWRNEIETYGSARDDAIPTVLDELEIPNAPH